MKIEIKELINIEMTLEILERLPDYRVTKEKIEHNQRDVLFGVLCSMFVGNIEIKDKHNWLKINFNEKYFKRLIGKENEELNIPSYSTIRRMIINIDSTILEEMFRAYFIPKVEFNEKTQLAVDGKTMNGSGRKGKYTVKRNVGMLNVVETASKIVIAHRELGAKKSEIPEFQKVLEMEFSDKPFLYTFDALNTQVESLNGIEAKGKRYLAKVKGNQKTLLKQVHQAFEEESAKENNTILEEKDKRESIEGNKWVKRETFVLSSKNDESLIDNSSFSHIKSIIKQVKYISDNEGKIKVKEQYLIANFLESATYFKEGIKDHWRCETYHYYKDRLTKEDDCKISVNPFGLAILRSFVINCIQLHLNKHKPDNKSLNMSGIFKSCGNNPHFLGRLVT
ncbi:MAG: ISAs1 family transposase [Sulfurovum sp.]|nr:ISAs1 family transposase [Sulfurovum sp.]